MQIRSSLACHDPRHAMRQPPAPPAACPVREPLSAAAEALLRHPSVRSQLVATASEFPHVLDRLGAVWTDPDALPAAIDSMLLTDRTGGWLRRLLHRVPDHPEQALLNQPHRGRGAVIP